MSLRVLVAVTGAFEGRLRVRRSSGELDTEGLERVLSRSSVRAIRLAMSLKTAEATLTAVHVDKGGGEDILREALSYGIDQGILIVGSATAGSDASTRASTIGDVYSQNGPFDVVIGPAESEFCGFSGALAAMAGQLDLPCVHNVAQIKPAKQGFTISYDSLFGQYELQIPRPCVVMAGQVPATYPTAWGIAAAYDKGILHVDAKQYAQAKARTTRIRIEAIRAAQQQPESVDGATLLRRLRSRGLLEEKA